ncbi:MAG: SRPBCC domain-containing protein [Thalassovita sp.]
MTDTTTLTKSIVLAAAPEVVWSYLTDKSKLGEWYHPAEKDLSADAAYSLVRQADDGTSKPQVWGDVLEWQPHKRLVTTFCIGPFEDRTSTVAWDLVEIPGGTRLTMTHTGIAEAAQDAALPLMMALDVGWDSHLADMRTSVNP